jgi:hypothetical protein
MKGDAPVARPAKRLAKARPDETLDEQVVERLKSWCYV